MFISENLPFYNFSLLCGHTNNEILIDPDKFGKESCFHYENIVRKECRELFEPLFKDLACVRNVRIQDNKVDNKNEVEFLCNCPVPCQARNYDITV